MLKFLSTSALLALTACGSTYQATSAYPPTPDKMTAQMACHHQMMAATPNPLGLVGALALIDERRQMTANCMAAHGWVLSE